MNAENSSIDGTGIPDTHYNVRDTFGLDVDIKIPGFSTVSEHVPELDKTYQFNHETTLAILAGFSHNRRVMVQGYHGTGKSTHIEQVAARLNWPCIRINLDSHVSRMDLIGKDAIALQDGKQNYRVQRKAYYHGHCRDLVLWSSTNMTPADLMLCLLFSEY